MFKALELDIRTDILLRHLGISYPPTQDRMVAMYGPTPPNLPLDEAQRGSGVHLQASEFLDTEVHNTTNYCQFVAACCLTQQLELGDEEITIASENLLGSMQKRVPYAHLGSVEKTECCGVCMSVTTDVGIFQPKCGCDTTTAEELRQTLQHRKVKRGNIAQIRQQENMMVEMIKLSVKLDLIASERGIAYPPSQATMNRVFGEGAELRPSSGQVVAERASISGRRQSASFVEVAVPMDKLPGDVFQAKGPCGSFAVTVPNGTQPGQRITVEVPQRPSMSMDGRELRAETEMSPLRASGAHLPLQG